jgi:iron complex outermembrane receptor protein
LETPFSISRADTEQISRIAATTIDGALSYDASIRTNNSGVASGNTFSVRGQSVDLTNGYKYDGLAFPYWFQDEPIESLSELQVLKGTGGFVYGYAAPSGVVNFVSKKPTKEFEASANLSLRSSEIWRTHLDFSGPFREGGSTAFRFNAVHEEGTLYTGAYNRNDFLTLWLQGNITPKLTWSADGFYQRTLQTRESNGISFSPTVTHLKPTGGTLNLGAPSTTKLNDIKQLTGRLNYEIDSNWTASAALRYSVLDERFPGNVANITDNAGDYQLGLLDMNRLFHYSVGQATINGHVDTGPVNHNIVAGLDYLDVNFNYDHQSYSPTGTPATSYAFNLNGNLYSGAAPDWGSNPAAIAYERPPNWFHYQEIQERGLFLSDTATLGNAELLVGGRYTHYKEDNYEPVLPQTHYLENSFTPIAALSYEFLEGVRAYVSYVQALQRGAQAPTNALNVGQSFGPLKSTQYEAGVKAQQSRWGGTFAAYRTSVPSDLLAPPAAGQTLGLWVRDGERRYQGVEFEAHAWPDPGRQVLLNFSTAYLDAKQTKAADPTLVGLTVPGTTAVQASGYAQYSPFYLPNFKVFGGLRYSGKSYGQAKDTFVFSPVTVGDVGAGYGIKAFTKSDIQIQGNIDNVSNQRYWIPNATGTGLSAGAPRVFTVSIGLVPRAEDNTDTAESGSSDEAAPSVERHDAKRAAERDLFAGHWYLGLDAGVDVLAGANYDIKSRLDPSLGTVSNGVNVKHDPGWELGGEVGYDFGIFRTEFEFSQAQASVKQVTLNSAQVPVDSSNEPAGTYDNPGGTTRVLAFLFNGLFDIGGDEHTPWALQAGGGIGVGNINSKRWAFQNAVEPAFQSDNRTALAWQLVAGVRRRITDGIDLTLKYRFFDVPQIQLFTTNANELDGAVRSHSVLLGTTVNF